MLPPDQTNTRLARQITVLRNPNSGLLPLGLDNRTFTLVLSTDQFQTGDLLGCSIAGVPPVRIIGYETRLPHESIYYVRIWQSHPFLNVPHRAVQPGVRWNRYYPPI